MFITFRTGFAASFGVNSNIAGFLTKQTFSHRKVENLFQIPAQMIHG